LSALSTGLARFCDAGGGQQLLAQALVGWADGSPGTFWRGL
jgi:hypothetical protein